MNKESIIRNLLTLVATLVVAAGVLSLSLRPTQEPTAVETAAGPRPSSTQPTPSTTTSTPPPTTTVPPTTVPPTTTTPSTTTPPPPSTTVPPTSTPPPPPTTEPPQDPSAAVSLRRGDEGPAVAELQRRLRGLGYWLGPADGTYGLLTEQAVTAFQKVEGLSPDGVAGPNTQAALESASRPTTSAAGDLVEVDKARQVLFVVRDGRVSWALNTSTGTERPYQVDGRTELADTPPGHWEVSWVVDGVDVGALGALYRPRYFHGDGIAVHGYHSVPSYPASHGCVRVTEAAMDWIWAASLMPIGSEVWVH